MAILTMPDETTPPRVPDSSPPAPGTRKDAPDSSGEGALPALSAEQAAAAAVEASQGKLSEHCFFFAFAVAVTLFARDAVLWAAVGGATLYAYLCMRTAARMGGRPDDAANLRLLMILLVFSSMSLRAQESSWGPFLYVFVCMLLVNAAVNIETTAQARAKRTKGGQRPPRSPDGDTART